MQKKKLLPKSENTKNRAILVVLTSFLKRILGIILNIFITATIISLGVSIVLSLPS